MSLPIKNSARQRADDRSRILTLLLRDDALTDSLLDPQAVQDAEQRDQTSELNALVNGLPAADVADALESLPPDERHARGRWWRRRSAVRSWSKRRRRCGTASSAG